MVSRGIMKNFLPILAGATAILSLMGGGVQAAIFTINVIDNFPGDQLKRVSGNVPTPFPFQAPNTETFNSSVLGDNTTRLIGGVLTSNPNRGGVQNQVFQGRYSDSNFNGAKSTSYIKYGGGNLDGSVGGSGLGADFLSGGADRIVFGIVENDSPAKMTVTVTDSDGTTGTASKNTTGKIPLDVSRSVLFDITYSSFTSLGGGDGFINFKDIKFFQVDIDARLYDSTDLSLDFVSTGVEVPESSSALGILALGGLGGLLSLTRKIR